MSKNAKPLSTVRSVNTARPVSTARSKSVMAWGPKILTLKVFVQSNSLLSDKGFVDVVLRHMSGKHKPIFQISKTLMVVLLLLVEEQMEGESLVKDASYFDDASLKSVAMHKYKIKMGLMMIAVFRIMASRGPIPTTEDTQEEDQGIDLGNLSPSYAVSSTPHTRIHKDHPIDHVIGDVQSSVQTRRMTILI
ncbi:hypothetical protein Tco_1218005 [Tanacetum coccineum]